MTGPVSGTDYGTRSQQTQLSLSGDESDPLVSGLGGGLQSVTTEPMIFTWGRPVAGAKISALLAEGNEAGIFRFEAGTSLAGGLVAPARRLGLMLEDLTAQSLSATGWTLVERAIDWTSNLAPQVSLQSPLAGSKVRRSGSVLLVADATDFDGSVAKVEYFADGVLIGSTTAAPHLLRWQPDSAGTYELTAKAHDNQESALLSEAVRIEVLEPFDYWLQQYFTDAQIQDPSVGGHHGDPDLDNIDNLLEYAFGFSPWEDNLAPLQAELHEDGGQFYPSLLYRLDENAEIEVVPELAQTLNGPWQSDTDHMLVEPLLAGDGYSEMSATSTQPLSILGGSAFFRLRASLPEAP